MVSLVQSTQRGDSRGILTKSCGVTLIELVIVVAIISVLAGAAYGLMTGLEFRTDTQISLDKIVAQIKSQKLRAMLGAGINGSPPSGTAIYFHLGTNKYTSYTCPPAPDNCLFSGDNTTNTQEESEESVSFSESTFSNNTIFFEAKSGEIKNYKDGEDNTLVVVNAADGARYLLKFSKIGSVRVVKQ